MKKKTSGTFIGTGMTTILLLFVMLCMMTFAVLSLVTARADLKQSQRLAERTTEYHESENAANDVLLTVIRAVEECLDAGDAGTFYRQVRGKLEDTEGITFRDDTHLEYTVPSGDEQLLRAALEISYEAFSDGSHYQVTGWSTESTHEWNADTPLPLYEPE